MKVLEIQMASRQKCRRPHQAQGKGTSGTTHTKLVHRGKPRSKTIIMSEDSYARGKLVSRLRKRLGGRRAARKEARRFRNDNGRNSYSIALMHDEQAFPAKPTPKVS